MEGGRHGIDKPPLRISFAALGLILSNPPMIDSATVGMSLQDVRARKKIGAWGILFLGLLGLGVLPYLVFVRTSDGLSSPGWSKTTGTLLKRDVVSRSSRRNARYSYIPAVEYEFSVGEARYHGTRLQAAPLSFWDPEKAWEILPTGAPGTGVVVFYDPGNPTRSVLRPGITRREILDSSVSLLVWEILVMLFVALLLWDRSKMSCLEAGARNSQPLS